MPIRDRIDHPSVASVLRLTSAARSGHPSPLRRRRGLIPPSLPWPLDSAMDRKSSNAADGFEIADAVKSLPVLVSLGRSLTSGSNFLFFSKFWSRIRADLALNSIPAKYFGNNYCCGCLYARLFPIRLLILHPAALVYVNIKQRGHVPFIINLHFFQNSKPERFLIHHDYIFGRIFFISPAYSAVRTVGGVVSKTAGYAWILATIFLALLCEGLLFPDGQLTSWRI